MAKAFSIASWNVEHFKGDPARTDRVIGFLKKQNPEIIGIYEVQGSMVFETVCSKFPGYTFQITEGPQTQEILVGVKSNLTAFLTQRIEFKTGSTYMRPGLLATVTVADVPYNVLFLHLASSPEPKGFGLRDSMAERAIKFRKTLNKKAPNKRANYIFLGDLNTMGLDYPYEGDIASATELRRWDVRASRYYDMTRLVKTADATFSNGSGSSYPDSDLDHVYASKHMKFKKFTRDDGTKADVDVRGWVNKATQAERDKWIADYSDHSLLYLEVQRV